MRFQDDAVVQYIIDYFGADSVVDDQHSGFAYDLDVNEVRIYLDAKVKEGSLSIINHNLDKDR